MCKPDAELVQVVRCILHAHLVELEKAGAMPAMFHGSITDLEVGECSAMEHCEKVAKRHARVADCLRGDRVKL